MSNINEIIERAEASALNLIGPIPVIPEELKVLYNDPAGWLYQKCAICILSRLNREGTMSTAQAKGITLVISVDAENGSYKAAKILIKKTIDSNQCTDLIELFGADKWEY